MPPIAGSRSARPGTASGCSARALNTQCKLLLLAHAFEKLDCIAVEFRTHFFNHQSRRAIERLGAKQDGILRNHAIAPNGTLRDTVVYQHHRRRVADGEGASDLSAQRETTVAVARYLASKSGKGSSG